MTAYYNEFDPKAAAWLRELIKAGHIASGEVDDRSIEDIEPSDLAGFTQCHFFAGIGGWSYALRLARWPDDRAVWTGSCPCQPFSMAGKGGGFADERHLWPAWLSLITQCRPSIVFGEQVASPAGLGWFDVVHADLEGEGYAIGAADLCAAGVGAPHIRQRLYFVAESSGQRFEGQRLHVQPGTGRRGEAMQLEYSESIRRVQRRTESGWRCAIGGCSEDADTHTHTHTHTLADHDSARLSDDIGRQGSARQDGRTVATTDVLDAWADAEWLTCSDGKYRAVEPGTFPLAHGIPGRVGLLRGYGNAIVPQVAAAFIEAYADGALSP